jgi:hypothetical protein
MEEIMLSAFSKMRRSRLTAISLAVIGGLALLLIVYSVQPTASRFDSSMRRPATGGIATVATPGAAAGDVLRTEPFFDYSLIFPEQPPGSAP